MVECRQLWFDPTFVLLLAWTVCQDLSIIIIVFNYYQHYSIPNFIKNPKYFYLLFPLTKYSDPVGVGERFALRWAHKRWCDKEDLKIYKNIKVCKPNQFLLAFSSLTKACHFPDNQSQNDHLILKLWCISSHWKFECNNAYNCREMNL